MSAQQFEKALARLYADAEFRAQFFASPQEIGRRCGLSDAECEQLARTDRIGLSFAAKSFERKRSMKKKMRE